MSAALKSPVEALLPKTPLSVEEYLATEVQSKIKREFVAGEVYAMSGARNVHNRVAMNFLGRLHAMLRGKPCQPFNSDTKVRIQLPTHSRFYYPDCMVVCQQNGPNEVYQDRPVVIAEVLSASTRRLDFGEKRDGYLTIPTLTDYLLIETVQPQATVFRRTPDGFAAGIFSGMEMSIAFDSIGVTLPMAELYEGVDFAIAKSEDEAEFEAM